MVSKIKIFSCTVITSKVLATNRKIQSSCANLPNIPRNLFITKLHVCAYFIHKVILPLLNCLCVRKQTDLLRIFPKLYTDLYAVVINILNEYSAVYQDLRIEEPDKK